MPDRLFDSGEAGPAAPAADAPLAVRMRPRTLDELVGQEHILGEGSALRTAIEIGPPAQRDPLRAARRGEDDAGADRGGGGRRRLRGGVGGQRRQGGDPRGDRAGARAATGSGRPTILFLDEIHRFNKAQQDALLPAVEEGLLTLIGATTENPYFEVNSALLSRCQVYELQPLEPAQVEELLRRALSDPERGLADPPQVEDAALTMLAHRSGGDARVALSALERAVERARAARRSTSPRPRTRCSARRSTTTARATATTTSSRPGSRRRAAPTSTPRSTTWR